MLSELTENQLAHLFYFFVIVGVTLHMAREIFLQEKLLDLQRLLVEREAQLEAARCFFRYRPELLQDISPEEENAGKAEAGPNVISLDSWKKARATELKKKIS